jgi:hypothetical protein
VIDFPFGSRGSLFLADKQIFRNGFKSREIMGIKEARINFLFYLGLRTLFGSVLRTSKVVSTSSRLLAQWAIGVDSLASFQAQIQRRNAHEDH